MIFEELTEAFVQYFQTPIKNRSQRVNPTHYYSALNVFFSFLLIPIKVRLLNMAFNLQNIFKFTPWSPANLKFKGVTVPFFSLFSNTDHAFSSSLNVLFSFLFDSYGGKASKYGV